MKDINTPPEPQVKPVESIDDRVQKLKDRRKAITTKSLLGYYEDSRKHSDKIKEAYGEDARKYKAFHVMILSTVEGDEVHPFYDFPEPEYSIEKFFDKEEAKYADKK